MAHVRRQRGSRVGTLLVLAGVAGVLTVTFVAGLWTGRHWPLLVGGPPSPARGEAAAGGGTATERPRQAEPLPALTFYHELTAPLTAPPPAPKPARPARPPEPRREADRSPAAPVSPPPAGAPLSSGSTGGAFTVQVGAYNLRTPAEALRTTLTAAGHDARVVEAGTPAGVRYRVHVGAFSTREAAREAAARLAAERSLPAFITTR